MRRSHLASYIVIIILGVGLLSYFTLINQGSWGQIQKISSDTVIGAQNPTITTDNNTIYCAWEASSFGNSDIYMTSSNLEIWSPIQKISPDFGNESQRNVYLDVENGKIHAVWSSNRDITFGDYDIFYRLYDGNIWNPEIQISEDSYGEWQGYPLIAVNKNNIHLTWVREENPWEEWGDEDIQYKYFDGFLWHPEYTINTNTTKSNSTTTQDLSFGYNDGMMQGWPAIAEENGIFHIVWVEGNNLDSDIFYSQFNGEYWLPKVELSHDIKHEFQTDPAITVSGGKVHVVWADKKGGDYDIVYRTYDGFTWSTEAEISKDRLFEIQRKPTIAAIGNEVYIAWEETREEAVNLFGRYYARTFWFPVQEIYSTTHEISQTNPVVSATSDTFHIVWMEDDSGIYYASFRSLRADITNIRNRFMIFTSLGIVCVLIINLLEKRLKLDMKLRFR